MLIRFCMLRRDVFSHSPTGVFQAAIELRDDGQLEPYEEEWLERELRWLRMHLPSPDCLRDEGNDRAICWFKADAKRAIEMVRDGLVFKRPGHGVVVSAMIVRVEPCQQRGARGNRLHGANRDRRANPRYRRRFGRIRAMD